MMFKVFDSQVRIFRQDGFLIVDKFVDEDTLLELGAAFDRMFRGRFETGITPDEVNWQEGTGDPSLTRQICNAWKADRAIARVVLREDFGEAIGRLGDWPGTRVMIDNVLWKPPDTRSLGYHQDSAYLDWYQPSDLLSLWIALDDTSAACGTMELVRGSHKWGHAPPEGRFHGPDDYRKYMEQAAQREGVEPDIVYVEVPRGGGSFHHGWTWHGSGHNTGDRPRRSLVLHAMRSDVQYNPDALGFMTGAVYGRYKHLADNDMDENYFPIIWQEDGYRTPGIEFFLGEANGHGDEAT